MHRQPQRSKEYTIQKTKSLEAEGEHKEVNHQSMAVKSTFVYGLIKIDKIIRVKSLQIYLEKVVMTVKSRKNKIIKKPYVFAFIFLYFLFVQQ